MGIFRRPYSYHKICFCIILNCIWRYFVVFVLWRFVCKILYMYTVPQDCFDKEKSSIFHYWFFNTNMETRPFFSFYKFYIKIILLYWRRAWQPTPAFLPGESPWTADSPRGGKELDMTVWLSTQHIFFYIDSYGYVMTHYVLFYLLASSSQ